jgi:hypothetical protein
MNINCDNNNNNNNNNNNKNSIKTQFAYNQRIQEVIRNHDKSKPLFLYYAAQNVHGFFGTNLLVPQQYEDKYPNIVDSQRRKLFGMVSILDESIGNLTRALEHRGMLDDTIIIFMSDVRMNYSHAQTHNTTQHNTHSIFFFTFIYLLFVFFVFCLLLYYYLTTKERSRLGKWWQKFSIERWQIYFIRRRSQKPWIHIQQEAHKKAIYLQRNDSYSRLVAYYTQCGYRQARL